MARYTCSSRAAQGHYAIEAATNLSNPADWLELTNFLTTMTVFEYRDPANESAAALLPLLGYCRRDRRMVLRSVPTFALVIFHICALKNLLASFNFVVQSESHGNELGR
jgi:hypothetical protein